MGEPKEPIQCSIGIRNKAKSDYESGFSNALNIYIWQICEYKGALYVTTLDHGSNIQTILEIFLLNKEALKKIIPAMKLEGISVEGIIKYCEKTLKELKDTNYQFGFDIFMSTDGIRFMPICLNGLGNRDNYGGRILFVSSENKLYIGTANPYEGCELWESDDSLRLLKM